MAEIILVLHFLVILFLVIGFPAGLMINHRGFRYFHCVVLAFVTLLIVLDLPCPLTLLEELFSKNSYGGSFLITWLNWIIYPQWIEPQHLFIANIVFAAMVFSSFYWYPLKPGEKKTTKKSGN